MGPPADLRWACHGAPGGEGAVLASLAMLAALRVAAGGRAPPVTAAARRGRGNARSGRESRPISRTGKQSAGRRGDHAVAFRVEGDGADRRPVAGRSAPAPRVGLAGPLVGRVAGGEDGAVAAGMARGRRDVADAAVVVFLVVPTHEGGRPLPCLGRGGEA